MPGSTHPFAGGDADHDETDDAAALLAEYEAEGLLAEYETDGYVYPAYGDRCFADVLPSALSLLTEEYDDDLPADALAGLGDVDNVVTIVLDGLGLDQWARLREDLPLLDAFETGGRVTPVTSVYPSETAAAITTFHTGLLPAEHGLLGWHQYVPEIAESIQTLPFLLEDDTPVPDAYPELDGYELFEGEYLYAEAEEAGVETHLFQPDHIATETETAYWNVADAAVRVRETIEAGDGPTHVSLYVPNVDSISHVVGTDTDRYDAQVRMVTEAIRTGLLEGLDHETAKNTAVVVSADHGHTNVEQDDAVDLSVEDVWGRLAQGSDGEPIPPCGGPRNVQFHVRDGEVEALREYLESSHDVLTFDREEYRESGLFGESHAEPGDLFEERAPDLLAVHRETVMWYEDDDKIGVHGGMTPEEMVVPLATGRASDLRD